MVSCPTTSEHGSDALLHHIRGEILWKRAAPVLPRFSSNSALRQPIPRLLARITHEELEQLFRGYGYTPYFVEGHEPQKMHDLMADTLDTVNGEIQRIQKRSSTEWLFKTAAMADDRVTNAKGLDMLQRDRWQTHRGLLALAHAYVSQSAR